MGRRITIKEIAQEAEVSTGTVHRAIYGKKGVSAEIRQKILELCTKYNYRTNAVASALKRGPIRVAAAFPEPVGKSSYFYSNVWKGFRRYISEMRDYNIEAVELLYSVFSHADSERSQAAVLAKNFEQDKDELDALITIGHFDTECKKLVRLYSNYGIPVFLACDDILDCGRTACVQANYDLTGQIVAELLSSQLPTGSTVLLCTGDELIPSHYQSCLGFERYLRENRVELQILKLSGYTDEPRLAAQIKTALAENPEIKGAFSVSARLSVLLADIVAELSLQDKIRVVASDLFDKTIQNMERGVIKNIIYKNPEQQAFLATKILVDYILKAEKPAREILYVDSQVIFKSNLEIYKERLNHELASASEGWR